MTGDVGSEGQSSAIGWVLCYSNTLIDPGQYAIGITGGHDIDVYSNNVFASRNNPLVDICNVGIYVQRWGTSSVPGSLYGCTVYSNNVLWYHTYQGAVTTPVANTSNAGYFPSTGGWDSASPNHTDVSGGTTVVNPSTSPGGNDFHVDAWDTDGGNYGYTALAFTETWTYYP